VMQLGLYENWASH